jgi:hypothetical protein
MPKHLMDEQHPSQKKQRKKEGIYQRMLLFNALDLQQEIPSQKPD